MTRFQLFGTIAGQFALLGKVERGMELAHENTDPQQKNLALTKIAQICALQNKEELARQVVGSLEEESQRVSAFIAVSDGFAEKDDLLKALSSLNEAAAIAETLTQLITRNEINNELVKRFYTYNEVEKARALASENLQIIGEILDEENRAIALAELATVFEKNGLSFLRMTKKCLPD